MVIRSIVPGSSEPPWPIKNLKMEMNGNDRMIIPLVQDSLSTNKWRNQEQPVSETSLPRCIRMHSVQKRELTSNVNQRTPAESQ